MYRIPEYFFALLLRINTIAFDSAQTVLPEPAKALQVTRVIEGSCIAIARNSCSLFRGGASWSLNLASSSRVSSTIFPRSITPNFVCPVALSVNT